MCGGSLPPGMDARNGGGYTVIGCLDHAEERVIGESSNLSPKARAPYLFSPTLVPEVPEGFRLHQQRQRTQFPANVHLAAILLLLAPFPSQSKVQPLATRVACTSWEP
jgi:hypothetical protein